MKKRVSSVDVLIAKKAINKHINKEKQDVKVFESHLSEMAEGILKLKKHYNLFLQYFDKTQKEDIQFKKQFELEFGFPYEKLSKINVVDIDLHELFVSENFEYHDADKMFKMLFGKLDATKKRLDSALVRADQALQPANLPVKEVEPYKITNAPMPPYKHKPQSWESYKEEKKREKQQRDLDMISRHDWD